jgi:hypothetical protein
LLSPSRVPSGWVVGVYCPFIEFALSSRAFQSPQSEVYPSIFFIIITMASLILARAVTVRELNGGRANFDALGIFYVMVAILYSIFVALEIYLLHRHRSNHSIRIRGFNVLIGSVSMLHVYLVLVLLAYPENGNWPCAAEYWIMSVFLPLGMALFQGTLTWELVNPFGVLLTPAYLS